MKRNSLIITIACIILIVSTSSAFASSSCEWKWKCKTRKHVTSVYLNTRKVCKMRTTRKLKCKVISSKKMTRKILTHRKNRYVLIEKVEWKPKDIYGNGRTLDGHYIKYDYDADETFIVGKTYTSYLVYGNNNYIDDVVKRIDTF